MLQFIIQGRGGQGAQKAGELLAEAFFREGNYIQAYSTYGGARRGTPVSSFIKVDDKPIRLRCDIENPDMMLCFDASLLSDAFLSRAGEKTTILINCGFQPEYFEASKRFKIVTLDAIAVAQRTQMGRIVNTALVGACAAILKAPNIDVLIQVLKDKSPARVEQNVQACLEGYRLVTEGGKN
ncbi:MAG: 2-oxoacid:acceptor oxidoreductase family protein [Firmicutes bacterium]|nr:2-oxoacid:acceptor oxidoreductase family protein [Bacillota bacterium]